jgi:26S proteasome regulatory subunit N13
MIPGDASFLPYIGTETANDSDNLRSPTSGRIFVLKFTSSSTRYLFWLQSQSQHPKGDPSWFSPRDLKVGQVVDLLLSGEDVDVQAELASVEKSGNDDEDDTMEDVEGTGDSHGSTGRSGSTGGAGSGATGGDFREEGHESREGGADGGRA